MKDSIFFDTNTIIYLYSITEKEKKEVLTHYINNNICYISTQVLNEFTNVMSKKYNVDCASLKNAIGELESSFNVVTVSVDAIKEALKIKEDLKFSYYDSLIIATAILCGCNIVLTEDMHHEQMIDGTLSILNPFVGM